jgi:L-threonylcarbamoyladenylate synthase
MKHVSHQQVVDTLNNGSVAIIATDTIYGIVGHALNRDTVDRMYALKRRTPSKPFIILVGSIDELALFGVELTDSTRQRLAGYWPGPVSIIVDCPDSNFEYLHRGTSSLAFRLPAKQELIDILKQTGPLVAPSANPEGLVPADTIYEAYDYFGDTVDA